MRTEEEVRRVLHEGAADPIREIDTATVLRQGRRGRRQRTLTRVIAGAMFAGALALLVVNIDNFGSSDRKGTIPPAEAPAGWTKLQTPPQIREGVALVWTGSEVLAWGGCDPTVKNDCAPTADGYVFDPESKSWSSLPPAPTPSGNSEAVWTGTKAIFFNLEGGKPLRGNIYDPSTKSWTQTAEAPITTDPNAISIWTGEEALVWGGGDAKDSSARSGRAYDPASDTWRRLPEAPVGLNQTDVMWTGDEMIVFGSLLDNRNVADTKTSVGAIYNPSDNRWREISPSDLYPQATSAVWAGDRMLAWDYDTESQEYDLASNTWSHKMQMPLEASECYPNSTVVHGLVFAFYCGDAALYDPSSSTWGKIHGGPLEETIYSKAYKSQIDLWRFAQLVPAGDQLFFIAEGITLADSGEACYGCPHSPHSFWEYRPGS